MNTPTPDPAPAVVGMPERFAYAGLSRLAPPGDHRIGALIRREGPVAVWERLRDRRPDIDPRRDLDRISAVGGQLICPGDPEWPPGLDALDAMAAQSPNPDLDPGVPLALWVRGRLDPAALALSVAVVGARASTAYGDHVAADLGSTLAGRGWLVISGAAFGIDAAAHRGALAAGGPTVAVLPGGVDVPYPRAHTALLDAAADQGAVISEAAPGTPPERRRFLARNRLIAALGRGTVVVEAGLRSGTLNTSRYTRQLGKPVMVVPGPVTSVVSAAGHRLLREHPESTVLVTGAPDVIDTVEAWESRGPVRRGGGAP